jgi:hypothetical protein
MLTRLQTPETVSDFFAASQLASFENQAEILAGYTASPPPTVIKFANGARFYRGAGVSSSGKPAREWGSWWIDVAEVHQREQGYFQLGKGLATLVRHQAAISYDWNDLSGLNQLTLPPGFSMLGLVGRAKWQPTHSAKSPQHLPNVFLMGGIEQIYFRAKDLAVLKEMGVGLQSVMTFE